MKNRSPLAVLLLPFITFGIYSIYWLVSTKIEMNNKGTKIPTALLLIVPIVNIWWYWKYCEGVEQVTNEKMSGILAFILLFLLGFIGEAIIQDSFNKVSNTTELLGAAEQNVPGVIQSSETPTNTPPPTNTPTTFG